MGRLTVVVSPGAARSEIVGRHGDAWKARLAAPPERGKANAALVELLSSVLRVAREEIELRSGASSRRKSLRIRGLETDEIERRLAQGIGI